MQDESQEIEIVENEESRDPFDSGELVDTSKSWVWSHFVDMSTENKNGEAFVPKKYRHCSSIMPHSFLFSYFISKMVIGNCYKF